MVIGITIVKKCQICGKEFKAQSHTSKYCSKACARIAKNAQKRNSKVKKARACKQCGKLFIPSVHHLKYCSSECALEARRASDRKHKGSIRSKTKGTPSYKHGQYCVGCYYRRSVYPRSFTICNYALDTGIPRNCPASECKERGFYKPKKEE